MLREFWGLHPRSLEDGKNYAMVLAYTDRGYEEAVKILKGENFTIVKSNYEKRLKYEVKALAVLASEEALKRVEGLEMVEVYPGYPYPDSSGIMSYMNYEHPPLVKYILALTMLVDDKPLTWRLPSLLLGSAILVLAYLAARRVFGEAGGLAAAIFVLSEQTVRAMSMVAMLDIYVSFFTLLALYLALRGGLLGSTLVVGLASSAKMTGFFNIPSLLASFLGKRRLRVLLPSAFGLPSLVYLLCSFPVMAHLGGFKPWLSELLGALKWHVTPRGEGPPSTDPLGLLFGFNAFPLSLTPHLSVQPNFLLNSAVIPLTFLLAPLALKGVVRGAGTLLAWFWSSYLGYVAVYLAGNTTLYSFYAVHFTPLAAILGGGIVYFINRPDKALEAVKIYLETFRRKAYVGG